MCSFKHRLADRRNGNSPISVSLLIMSVIFALKEWYFIPVVCNGGRCLDASFGFCECVKT